MTTRRGFLAGMGLGAFGFGLPGRAHAHGWGRRRGSCAPTYYPAVEQACSVPQCSAGRDGNRFLCVIACPKSLYSYSNGVWYYLCYCCSNNSALIVPCSAQLTNLVDCADLDYTYCFSLPNGRPGEKPPIETSGDPSLADGLDVVIRPWIKTPPKAKMPDPPFTGSPAPPAQAADAYINRTYVRLKTGQQQDDDINAAAIGEQQKIGAVTRTSIVKYDNRIVKLYDLTDLTGTYKLHVGYEVSDPSGANDNPAATVWDWRPAGKIQTPRYHHVWLGDPTTNKGYHVVAQ